MKYVLRNDGNEVSEGNGVSNVSEGSDANEARVATQSDISDIAMNKSDNKITNANHFGRHVFKEVISEWKMSKSYFGRQLQHNNKIYNLVRDSTQTELGTTFGFSALNSR